MWICFFEFIGVQIKSNQVIKQILKVSPFDHSMTIFTVAYILFMS